jgi:hypothetical protein
MLAQPLEKIYHLAWSLISLLFIPRRSTTSLTTPLFFFGALKYQFSKKLSKLLVASGRPRFR